MCSIDGHHRARNTIWRPCNAAVRVIEHAGGDARECYQNVSFKLCSFICWHHADLAPSGSYGFAKISEDLKDALIEVQPILEFSAELLAKAAIPASVRVVDTSEGLQCWTSSDASVPELLQINGSKKTRLAHAWNARFAPLQ